MSNVITNKKQELSSAYLFSAFYGLSMIVINANELAAFGLHPA